METANIWDFVLDYHQILNVLEITLGSWGLLQIMSSTAYVDVFHLEGEEHRDERKKRVRNGLLSLGGFFLLLFISQFIKW